MATRQQDTVLTLEQQAIKEVERMESSYHLGMSLNLTDQFSKYRRQGPATQPLPPVQAAVRRDEEGNIIPNTSKYWMENKDIWDTDFATMHNDLQDLRDLYRDRQVVTFNDAADKRRNAKIKKILHKIQNSFRDMKLTVDKLNHDLYSKQDPKNSNCGPGRLFENVTEWRIGERVVTDLTCRLKAKQQELNKLIMEDTRLNKFTPATAAEAGTSTKAQQEIVMLEKALMKQREQELQSETQDVKEIVEAVQQIVRMVQDMSTMITEQGTIVDRIDYNLEVASARTLRGEKHFEQAEKYNKKATGLTLYCIACLVILNTIMMIVILAKTK